MERTLSRVVCLLVLCFAATFVSAQVSDSDSQNAPPDADTPAAAPAPAPAPTPAPAPVPSPRVQNLPVPNQPSAPDMVCFGYYPRWTVQFTSGRARYLADNQAPQTFKGDFVWVPDENAWDWNLANSPPTGSHGLSAAVEKANCHDITLNENFPYSAEVYVPRGDMVSGCCRKLKPGEGQPVKAAMPASPNMASQNQ
jgi:hypothetical protein